jgi:hypothetical protein
LEVSLIVQHKIFARLDGIVFLGPFGCRRQGDEHRLVLETIHNSDEKNRNEKSLLPMCLARPHAPDMRFAIGRYESSVIKSVS